jgi:GrpB-like predicted nucleotidyltransferase (UPF0157 family)
MPEPEFLVERETVTGVVLSEPGEEWFEQYAVEEALILGALGGRATQLHHAGSTAVPGLAAKPVIDVVLAVADPVDEAAYVPALEGIGYVLHHREPHWHQHRLLKKGMPHWAADRPPMVRVNLHVFPAGCEEVRRMLAFRDWLRVDLGDRKLYEDTKRSLAAKPWASVQDYADAKSEVVTDIMGRALAAQPWKGVGSPAPTRTTSG